MTSAQKTLLPSLPPPLLHLSPRPSPVRCRRLALPPSPHLGHFLPIGPLLLLLSPRQTAASRWPPQGPPPPHSRQAQPSTSAHTRHRRERRLDTYVQDSWAGASDSWAGAVGQHSWAGAGHVGMPPPPHTRVRRSKYACTPATTRMTGLDKLQAPHGSQVQAPHGRQVPRTRPRKLSTKQVGGSVENIYRVIPGEVEAREGQVVGVVAHGVVRVRVVVVVNWFAHARVGGLKCRVRQGRCALNCLKRG